MKLPFEITNTVIRHGDSVGRMRITMSIKVKAEEDKITQSLQESEIVCILVNLDRMYSRFSAMMFHRGADDSSIRVDGFDIPFMVEQSIDKIGESAGRMNISMTIKVEKEDHGMASLERYDADRIMDALKEMIDQFSNLAWTHHRRSLQSL